MTPSEIFEGLAAELAQRDGVRRNARGSLTTDGVRAMTSTGHVVVKLDRERVAALVADGVGTHYKDQVNAWLQLDPDLTPEQVRALVEESLVDARG